MRRALAIALLLSSPSARAEAPPYDYLNHLRILTGPGFVPTRPGPQGTWVMNAEYSRRPLHGALATGLGLGWTTELQGAWSIVTPTLLVRYDIAYPFVTHLWAHEPAHEVAVRVYAGLRFGVDVSQSYRLDVATPEPPYTLVRPVFQPTFDVEVPLRPSRSFVLVGRVSWDMPASFDDVWRYAITFGLGYAWEREGK